MMNELHKTIILLTEDNIHYVVEKVETGVLIRGTHTKLHLTIEQLDKIKELALKEE